MPKERKQFSSAQKAEIVNRHLVGNEPVSALADEFQVQPALIYNWVKVLLDQAETTFESSRGPVRSDHSASHRCIEQLQAKLVQKNEVIAELMEENLKAKRANGDL